MRYLCFVIYFLFSPNITFSQLIYPVVGTYNRKAAQSMAIYGDFAFLFNHGGECRQLNLATGKIARTFFLACSHFNPHVNNVCFGSERVGNSQYPVIYISECMGDYRCFVESLDSKARLVQTIQASAKGKIRKILNWVVDRDENAIYAITRIHKKGSEKVVDNLITKYRLPKLKEGPFVMLTEKDVIEKFIIPFSNALQDSKIRNGLLYQSSGLSQLSSYKNSSERAVMIINLKNKEIINKIDLTHLTTHEPEGIDFYNDKCLLFCGQQGGIYEVKLK